MLVPTTTQTGQPAAPARLWTAERRVPGRAWAGVVLAILCAVALAVILHAGRNQSFFADDWEFVLHRRGMSPGTFLRPHVDHPSVLPVAEYKLLLQVFGMGSYTPFRLMVALAHVVTGVLLYLYSRRRVGAWLALLPAALMLFLGAAWEDLTWAFQIGFVGAVMFGLASLLALDAERDGLACLALLASTCCSALAIPFIVIAAVRIGADERRLQRAWVLAPAVVLFAVIRWGYGTADPQPLAPPAHAVPWSLDMAAAGVAGVFGLGVEWGRPLLLAGAAALFLAFPRRPERQPQLAALLCGAGVFWLLTGFGRADLPGIHADQSRYIYLSGALVLLLLVTAIPRPRLRRGGAIALSAGTLVVCLVGAGLISDGAATQAPQGQLVRLELTALDVARGHVAPRFQVDPSRSPDILAASYYSARDAFGSPALPTAVVRGAPEGTREAFDAALAAALALHLGPAPTGTPAGGPPAATASGGQLTTQGACVRFQPAAAGATVELTLPAGTYGLTASGAPANVRLRRLAAGYPQGHPLQLAAGATRSLALPRDGLPDPWHAQVTSGMPVRVCAVG